ncbi:hypothetical protein CAI21_01530 [Alkalilimnicola ehrlichii]|uniref:Phage tail protein n=1 Tax=Alkalilimnicola ehrlichii TaxID=351052 RepID=A0A3E0X3H6_9GAMM|nr:phage tail protein [Alkalilimnicola ehrlichii]RFA31336.1 hypothetical protein CAI21_01530 [Alkalilimnicola ehrlichii]RFA39390.1 hypothetical protein CAL65_00880 [Alkalilimnicola ehrlichii]
MEKLTALRQHLVTTVPSLEEAPEKLSLAIEEGRIEYWQGGNLSHLWRCPVQIAVSDYPDSLDSLVIPLLEWLHAHEPGHAAETGIEVDAPRLNDDAIDLTLTVTLSERVIVASNESGQQEVTHVIPEPPPAMNDDAELTICLRGPTEREDA